MAFDFIEKLCFMSTLSQDAGCCAHASTVSISIKEQDPMHRNAVFRVLLLEIQYSQQRLCSMSAMHGILRHVF